MNSCSAGFHGNMQLSPPSAHNIAGMCDATRDWITFVCFRWPEVEQCAECSVNESVIQGEAVSFVFISTHEYERQQLLRLMMEQTMQE